MPLRVEPRGDRELYRLVEAAPDRATHKGDVLFRQGESGTDVYLVREGHVCLRMKGITGPDRTVAVVGPGELFGEEAMVPGAPRLYTAVAGAPGSLARLAGSAVRSVLRSSERTLTLYMEGKERDLRLLRSAAAGSPGPSARARLAGVVLDLASRLGEPVGEGVRVPHWFTHRELADMAGVHRSTVTTALNDWIWRGFLAPHERALLLTSGGRDGLAREGGSHVASVDPNSRQD